MMRVRVCSIAWLGIWPRRSPTAAEFLLSPDLHDPQGPLAVRGHAVISRKGAARLAAGHVWVYASDVLRRPTGEPCVVEVQAEGGRDLGLALHAPQSRIALRLLSRGRHSLPVTFVRDRMEAARERRERVLRPGTTTYRWVHGEADLLPSLFVDRYGDVVVVQSLSAGGDVLAPFVIDAVRELAEPRAIVLRNDATARSREGLPLESRIVLGTAPVVARYREGDIELDVDLLADQKTGSFLDQTYNHLAAAGYGRGEALDCFTYHGGFALQLARVCVHVIGVDASETALTRARANAERAGLGNVEWQAADVLALLPALAREGRRFDTIVLDPPAFASNRASEERALRAYKEVNLRAMKLLRPAGILITCSCSGRITPPMFDDILAQAAADVHRNVQVLERRGAGPDHPVLLGVPETEYLKCCIACVL